MCFSLFSSIFPAWINLHTTFENSRVNSNIKTSRSRRYLDRGLKTTVEGVAEAESGGVGDDVGGCGTPCGYRLMKFGIGWKGCPTRHFHSAPTNIQNPNHIPDILTTAKSVLIALTPLVVSHKLQMHPI